MSGMGTLSDPSRQTLTSLALAFVGMRANRTGLHG
jgi:hypothetical protein